MKKYLSKILEELSRGSGYIDEKSFDKLIELIEEKKRIFLVGKGRSGLMISAFANRLIHLGYSANVIGEITCPHTRSTDLLIVASGSGETSSLISLAEKAKSNGVQLVLITSNKNSKLAKMADVDIVLFGSSKIGKTNEEVSIQPMGTLFEQMLELSLDALVLKMMQRNKINSETMLSNHADLE